MTHRPLLALAVAALLVVPGLSLAAVTGSPDLSVQFANERVVPGEQTSVDLVLVNEGEVDQGSASNPSLTSEVTKARGLTATVESGRAPVTVLTGTRAIGTLPEGATDPIPVTVAVDEDAEAGTYHVPVEVSYTHTELIADGNAVHREETVTRTLHAAVTVEEAARVEVVDVTSDARVGSTGTLALTVENTGTVAANDTRLAVESRSGEVTFGEASSASRYLGAWEPGEQRTVRFQATAGERAEPGEYPLAVSADYETAGGRDMETVPVRTGVGVAPEQSFAIDDVDSTLAVGDDGELSGTVTNTGDRPVPNVVLTWASEQRNVSPTETEYAVGTLESGESATFDFDVEVSDSARSGPRQFSLVAEYEDADGTAHESDRLSVRQEVGPATDAFDVELVEATVVAGGSSVVEMRLTNADDERLTDVSAKLFADSPLSATDDEAYVAGLAPGETTNLTFSVAAAGSALAKAYPLSMDFQYDEPDGDTVTSDTYRVPVTVTASGDGGGVPVLAIGGAGVLVLLGIGAFLRFR